MNFGDEKRVWIFAVMLSLVLHAALLALPSFRKVRAHAEEPIITISLRRMPKAEPRQAAKPAPSAPRREERKVQEVKKETPKAVKKEKPSKLSKTAAEKPVPEVPAESVKESGVSETTEPPSVPQSGATGGEAASGSGSGAVVDAASLRIIKKVLPDYPSFSRKRREEGTVAVIVTIEKGSAVSAEVERSSGFPRLDASAVRAVMQWKFDQTPRIRARVPFVFKLTN